MTLELDSFCPFTKLQLSEKMSLISVAIGFMTYDNVETLICQTPSENSLIGQSLYTISF